MLKFANESCDACSLIGNHQNRPIDIFEFAMRKYLKCQAEKLMENASKYIFNRIFFSTCNAMDWSLYFR